ncbi:MAG: tetratricopeptide repeat protein [Bryobacterales bacterium]|nr:tetratricopeptide repeat protein [Bryobacterales bacterium]
MPSNRTTRTPQKPQQFSLFEEAARAFRNGNFAAARSLFQKAAQGPDREITNRAQLHVAMCERRLSSAAPAPKTAEEHYTYAVALMNSHDLAGARKHLETAIRMDPKPDHFYYALALCLGLSGDSQGAYQNLKRAIELRPQNRIAARQDADFAPLIKQPPLDRLLFP